MGPVIAPINATAFFLVADKIAGLVLTLPRRLDVCHIEVGRELSKRAVNVAGRGTSYRRGGNHFTRLAAALGGRATNLAFVKGVKLTML